MPSPNQLPAASPWRIRFAWLTALATLGLIGMGGLVTSHGVGMAVPDWPTTYGYNPFLFPVSQWVGGIFYEHSHRLWASLVGLFTIVLALWLLGTQARPWLRWGGGVFALLGVAACLRFPDHLPAGVQLLGVGVLAVAASFAWPRCQPASRALRWLGGLATVLVILQGVLGGLRVTLLKNELGIFHATLAQVFLCLLVVIALLVSGRKTSAGSRPVQRGFLVAFALMTGLVLGQLVLGATMRHQHAGLAIPDFPLAYGQWWPATDHAALNAINQSRSDARDFGPVTAFQVHLHMVHRLMAVAILLGVTALAVSVKRRLGDHDALTRLGWLWLALIIMQAALGVFTVLKNKPADIATLHVVCGALGLVIGVLGTLSSLARSTARNGARVAGLSASRLSLPSSLGSKAA